MDVFIDFNENVNKIDKNDLELNTKYLKMWIEINLKIDLEKFFFIDFHFLEISSTTVRKNISNKKSINYLVPEKVIQLIISQPLFTFYIHFIYIFSTFSLHFIYIFSTFSLHFIYIFL